MSIAPFSIYGSLWVSGFGLLFLFEPLCFFILLTIATKPLTRAAES